MHVTSSATEMGSPDRADRRVDAEFESGLLNYYLVHGEDKH